MSAHDPVRAKRAVSNDDARLTSRKKKKKTSTCPPPPLLQCSLRCCPRPLVCVSFSSSQGRAGGRARIRIKPTEARRIGKYKSVGARAKVRYDKDGIATMHRSCYMALAEAAGTPDIGSVHEGKDCEATKKDAAKAIAAEGGVGRSEARALREAAELVEMWDSEAEMESKADAVFRLLRGGNGVTSAGSPHVIAFTGAGISTSAGIGDYRGLKGKWTEDDLGLAVEAKTTEEDDGVPYEDLRPTFAHEALAALVADKTVDYIVSQNCDGLHSLSGVPDSKLSELHGNVFREYCEDCGTEYQRQCYVPRDDADDYYSQLSDYGKTDLERPWGTRQCKQCGLNHRTGQRCSKEGCRGRLRDTIINFGDNLRPCVWDPAEYHSERADVVLALGSTLLVTPAAHLVLKGGGKLVIVNRQRTGCDRQAAVVVRGDADIFLQKLMARILGDREGGLAGFLEQCARKSGRYDLARRKD